ncbi:hypothetical protein BD410DRAFT_782876 [Rickenella mellea]|uniref:Uncharacterized protein n=1 Tax=Rickenella mellea TaxID=50990 RepID=A0A4Y7QHV3_9AGAM|nr:hypothetical protein BD410DRAFT_782876 [Rickenella mellea]
MDETNYHEILGTVVVVTMAMVMMQATINALLRSSFSFLSYDRSPIFVFAVFLFALASTSIYYWHWHWHWLRFTFLCSCSD